MKWPTAHHVNKQQGFSIIELMIAGLIGLFLMAGMMNLFITTNKSVTLSDALSQNQETGRFAMDYLTKFVRRAGYTDDFTKLNPPIFGQGIAVSLPDGSTRSITCGSEPEASACAANNPGGIIGDRLSIPFIANANTEIRSCTGTLVGGPGNGQQYLANVFWVSDESDSRNELRCRTYDIFNQNWLDNSVSIVSNVDGFEFQVGLAALEENKNASQYVSVDTMSDNLRVNSVRSIRLAILTTSKDQEDDRRIQSTVQDRVYGLLDSPQRTVNDGSLRHIFSNTIELPNMIEGAGQ